ncbi:SUMO-conjugating enzyme ubc9 [Hypsizygus marmoreus]|uniref:SUMO-conjugating enzyme ubc9 n=1 Tax=Hypsizygus marmoreus TaxID=39966 RepID=A0A369JQE0_HYPMA|nr:SUMO-conjugating enzyme ubc9 [Hypsizygus marmoreus]
MDRQQSCKKRKLSSLSASTSPHPPDHVPDSVSTHIRAAISRLVERDDVPPQTLAPLLESLTTAYTKTIPLEDTKLRPSVKEEEPEALEESRAEDWDWTISMDVVASMDTVDLSIWKEMYKCREEFHNMGILVNPQDSGKPIVNLKKWEAHIPGVANTSWGKGVYTLSLEFEKCQNLNDLLNNPPRCKFIRPLFHVNCYPSGTWAFNDQQNLENVVVTPLGWADGMDADPSRLLKLVRNVQIGLIRPNLHSPVASDPYTLFKDDPAGYEKRIREQAQGWQLHPTQGLAGRRVLKA